MRFSMLLLVGLGGAMGTLLRVAISLFAQSSSADHAYLATLLANILGAGLIGVLSTRDLPAPAQALLMTGFCGGFTTFSMFSLEAVTLLQVAPLQGAAYMALSLALWLVAVWVGVRLGRGNLRP